MTTQVIKAQIYFQIPVRSQILCQQTEKITRELKSPTFADSELSECHKCESVSWQKVGLQAGLEGKINC